MNEDKDNNKNQSSNENSDDENYVVKTKVCKRLSRELKELELEEIVCDENIRCELPPDKHGLSNSDVIIPAYYNLHKNPSKILDLDFFEIIKDDIKNLRPLNKYQLKYIKEIKDEYKYELIEIFNECLYVFKEFLDEKK